MDNALAVHDFVGVLHGVQGRFDLGSRHDKPRLAFFRGVRVPETCIVRREVLEVSFLYELRPFTSTVRVVTRHRAGAVTTTGTGARARAPTSHPRRREPACLAAPCHGTRH